MVSSRESNSKTHSSKDPDHNYQAVDPKTIKKLRKYFGSKLNAYLRKKNPDRERDLGISLSTKVKKLLYQIDLV